MIALLLACWPATTTDSADLEWGDTAPVLELIGDYVGSDGSVVVVTSETFRVDERTDTITDFSNASRWLTAENDVNLEPGFTRIDWRSESGQWWLCRSVDDAVSEQDALDADRPSDDDCLGEPWVSLTLAP